METQRTQPKVKQMDNAKQYDIATLDLTKDLAWLLEDVDKLKRLVGKHRDDMKFRQQELDVFTGYTKDIQALLDDVMCGIHHVEQLNKKQGETDV